MIVRCQFRSINIYCHENRYSNVKQKILDKIIYKCIINANFLKKIWTWTKATLHYKIAKLQE